MSPKPFFSVIIPTLNEEDYLPKLLGDLTKQRNREFEVIVVDGSSTDSTKQKALLFKRLNLRFFTVKKRGTSFQKNFGASKAKGEYLIFLDADTRISSTFIQKIKKEASQKKYLIFLPALRPQGGTYTDKLLFNVYNFLVDVSQNMPKPFITPGAMIFQKDLFFFIGMFPENKNHQKDLLFPEDHEIVLNATKSGVRARFLNKIKVGFSLRRLEKEGRLNVINKYIVSALEMTTKGKLDSSLRYEMGGHHYKKGALSKKQLKALLSQVKKKV